MIITIAQQNYTIADIKGNLRKITTIIRESNADVIVFPEGAITGLPILDMNLDAQLNSSFKEIAMLAPEKEILVGGGPFQAAYITGGKVEVIDNIMVQLGGIMLFFEATHFSHNIPQNRLKEMRNLSAKQNLPVVMVNQVGASTDTVYYGGSAICFPSGEYITMPLWKEAVLTVDMETPTESHSDWGSEIEQTHQAILLGIHDYFQKSGVSDACVALSGGIDSAIVVALAVEALGAERVRVLMLPSKYSSKHSVADSLEMVRRCGIRHDIVNIEPIFEAALTSIKPIFNGAKEDTTEENMQARIRLMLTMALSNKTGALMLNTSNKSEIAVGYGTLYGDTGGALGVIADLYKSEVYQLARHINIVSGELIPQNIIDKAPSAELRPNQFDSDSLPPYDTLDPILYRLIEKRLAPEDIIVEGYPSEVVHRVAKLLWSGDFKRKQLPPAIRLSRTTLSVEYQMPITKARYV